MEFQEYVPMIAAQVGFWSVYGYGMYKHFQKRKEETKEFNESKQRMLDTLDRIASPEYQNQREIVEARKRFEQQRRRDYFLRIGRPDLALPHIYATKPIQYLETRLDDEETPNLKDNLFPDKLITKIDKPSSNLYAFS